MHVFKCDVSNTDNNNIRASSLVPLLERAGPLTINPDFCTYSPNYSRLYYYLKYIIQHYILLILAACDGRPSMMGRGGQQQQQQQLVITRADPGHRARQRVFNVYKQNRTLLYTDRDRPTCV